MSMSQAYIAATRFGFGAKSGELKDISSDPKAWLKEQLTTEYKAPVNHFAELLPTYKVTKRYYDLLSSDLDNMRKRFLMFGENLYEEEAYARTLEAISTTRPFYERLVQFWSNHFAVSSITTEVKSYQMKGYVGSFERDAIRPYVLSKFTDILLTAERHPAMLIYLDNRLSMGDNISEFMGHNSGLNENHAREILELHTLGVDGGYIQKDVREFAKILTGWVIELDDIASANGFRFNESIHQVGDKTLLGKAYKNTGESEGILALVDLAENPNTAKHIAYKMLVHFVTESPSETSVKKLAKNFQDSGGDLKELAIAMVDLDESWSQEYRIKQPNHYIISAIRAVSNYKSHSYRQIILDGLMYLGQYPFKVNSPEGFPDESSAWNGAGAMMRRVQWAQEAGKIFTGDIPVDQLAQDVLGDTISDLSLSAIKQAKNQHEAIAMLFACPEFQVR